MGDGRPRIAVSKEGARMIPIGGEGFGEVGVLSVEIVGLATYVLLLSGKGSSV